MKKRWPTWTASLLNKFFNIVKAMFSKQLLLQSCTKLFSVVTSFGFHLPMLIVEEDLSQHTLKTNWCVYAVQLSKKIRFLLDEYVHIHYLLFQQSSNMISFFPFLLVKLSLLHADLEGGSASPWQMDVHLQLPQAFFIFFLKIIQSVVHKLPEDSKKKFSLSAFCSRVLILF